MEITGALYQALKDLAPGGAWESIADRDAVLPYIIITPVTASNRYTLDKQMGPREGKVDVKVITEGASFVTAESIRAAFDTALHELNDGNDYGIQMIIRETEIRYPEYDGDIRYNHLGWTYRYIMAEPGQGG
ncbi:MAG: hypothetical protein ABFD64_02890 [Armatimonadota bacterium]